MGSLYQPKRSQLAPNIPIFFFPKRREDYRLGNVLCLQLSELLAGSSLTLITFSSSTLQLADVATNFCHTLNLYIAFLARVQFKSVSRSTVCEQRGGCRGTVSMESECVWWQGCPPCTTAGKLYFHGS